MAKTKKTNTKKDTTTTAPKRETKAEAPRFEPIAERDAAVLRKVADTMARLRAAFDKGDGDAIRADFTAIQEMARDMPRVVYIARRAGRRLAPPPVTDEAQGDDADASGNDSLPESDPDKVEG